MRTGQFIAFEGVDGCGKSTQLKLLHERLARGGRSAILVREPGGTALGERVRALLLDDAQLAIGAEAEALLFLASRVQLFEQVIAPVLAQGGVVLSDRFHISTLVYQGLAGELGLERAQELCGVVLGARRPDVNVVLDLPLADCLARVGSQTDRIEGRPGFLPRVHEAFARIQGLDRDRIVHVDGRGAPAEVAARVDGALHHIWPDIWPVSWPRVV
ncbi:MAG: dTMP kinase [Planctomycetota bacterium]